MSVFIYCAMPEEAERVHSALKNWHESHYIVSVPGIGMLSTLNNLWAHSAHKYDYILNVGFVGAVSSRFQIGSTLLISEFKHFIQDYVKIPNYNPEYTTATTGYVLSSCDTFASKSQLATLQECCDVVDMEAYAIAMFCRNFHKKFMCVKQVSDILTQDNHGYSSFEDQIKDLDFSWLPEYMDQLYFKAKIPQVL